MMISPPEKPPDQFMAVAVIRPTIAAGRLALMDLQLGMACYRKLPAEVYHPGTGVADHREIEKAATRVLDACR